MDNGRRKGTRGSVRAREMMCTQSETNGFVRASEVRRGRGGEVIGPRCQIVPFYVYACVWKRAGPRRPGDGLIRDMRCECVYASGGWVPPQSQERKRSIL